MKSSDDCMSADELIDAASGELLAALALLDDIHRRLQGESLPPRKARCKVLLFSARSRKKRRGRNAGA